MPRYRITIEYDGAPFFGWQIQDTGATVQAALTQALHKFSGETVSVRGAGRTDTGVHALGQVAHFDLARDWPPDRIREALNYHLRPDPVAIIACAKVDDDFDARFSAIRRHYLYRYLSRRAPPVLDRGRVWWLPYPLDADAMHAAASVLIGQHDFTTFRAAGCQSASPVKTLDVLRVARVGDEVHLTAIARSFLHNQVRSIAGSLKLVGEGRWSRDDMAAALASRDRARCGPVAPPQGLYLTQVDYADAEPSSTSSPQPSPEIPGA